MTNLKAYEGGCQCGRVRFEVKMDLTKPVISCNCSMCGRSGTLLGFVPASDFTLRSGEDVLTDYLFNHKHIHHLFCSVCGIKSFARGVGAKGEATVAVNTRCLDGVDPQSLSIEPYDGRAS